jgi:general stress protein 26
MPRRLTGTEVDAVLAMVKPAYLATIDADGYPQVTPLWFDWDGVWIRMTSFPASPHVRRLHANPRACVLVDTEQAERSDGERPNQQVRLVGDVELSPDRSGEWTRKITRRYLTGPSADRVADRRAGRARIVIGLRPLSVVAVGSV